MKQDINDTLRANGIDGVRARHDRAYAPSERKAEIGYQGFNARFTEACQRVRAKRTEVAHTRMRDWPDPKPLPNGLVPVDPFKIEFMPEALASWIGDIADRLQCPPDYAGVAAMTALGSVIGRRVGVKPQEKTDWTEYANIWGGFIGWPGMLKSPAMAEALAPLYRLEAEAAKDNEVARQAYDSQIDVYTLRKQVAASLAKNRIKQNATASVEFDLGDQPKEPLLVRYLTNDSSYEALGELLIGNPGGLLVVRDEMISLLKQLDRDDQAVARGFYLSGWAGSMSYTFDRIGRGQRHVPAVCISLLGNTQPARMCEYVRRANIGGTGGDGLIQRFNLLVWPDTPVSWKNVDQYPAVGTREKAWQAFERASKLNLSSALAIGASKTNSDKVPCFRLDAEARADFLSWRNDLEARLRSAELSPAFEGHLAKYRKLVPALALIDHIADRHEGEIAGTSIRRALAFVSYLESHARRIYGSASEVEVAAAKAILKHIRADDLQNGFTLRDIHQRDWAHLGEREHVVAGLGLLVELNYLAEVAPVTGPLGGRPKITYAINPRITG